MFTRRISLFGLLFLLIEMALSTVCEASEYGFLQDVGVSSEVKSMQIGSSRQLFFDDQLVAQMQGVSRIWHQPVKHDGNPLSGPDQPWEGGVHPMGSTVMRDPETGLFRMWYMNYPTPDAMSTIAYAESQDGLHWTKPILNVLNWNGSDANNLVLGVPADTSYKYGVFGGAVFVDENETDAGQRYKMIFSTWDKNPGLYRSDGAILIKSIASPDGIHWNWDTAQRLFEAKHDITYVNVNFERDPSYVIYQADVITPPQYRKVARWSSTDMMTWHEDGIVLERHPSEGSQVQFYDMAVQSIGDLDVGLVNVFDTESDTIHMELAYSRDQGLNWQRVNVGSPFVELGAKPDAPDWGMIIASNQMVEVDDEYWIYYSGWDGRHDTELPPERVATLNLATIRRDGFASLHADADADADSLGLVTTRPIVFEGSHLVINAKVGDGGQIRVALLDENDLPLLDMGLSDIFTGDNANHVVTWDGNGDLAQYAGRPIVLQFELVNADLYSFQFLPEPASVFLLNLGLGMAMFRRNVCHSRE